MNVHRPFRKIGKRKQGGKIMFYAKEQFVWHRIREDVNKEKEVTVSACYRC